MSDLAATVERDSDPSAWLRWNRKMLACLGIVAATLPVVNVVVDPFDIFMVSPIGTGPYLNQRLHHSRTLQSATQAPEVLILGDSIMGINDPSTVIAGTGFRSAYNASVFMASAVDVRDLATFVSRLQRKPKLVVIAVDTYMFSGQPQPDSFSIKMPPDISGQGPAQWWMQALFAPGLFPAYDKATEKISGQPSAVFNTVDGHYSRPQLDAEIDADPGAYSKRIFTGVPKAKGQPPTSEVQLRAASEAGARLAAAGVDVLWVLQPPSHGFALMYSPQAIEANRAAIAAHMPPQNFLDLSHMSTITNDPTAWYDLKHYTPGAGRAIASAIAARLAAPRQPPEAHAAADGQKGYLAPATQQ